MNRVKEINLVFCITVAVAVLGSFVMSSITVSKDNYFLALLFSQVILVIPMMIYIIYTKQNILKVICFKKISPINIILAIILAYLINPLMTLLNAISLLFSTNVIDDKVTNVVENNPLFLSVFAIAVIPAIFEESVYRGIFFNEYRKVNPLKAIFLSGLLFGLMHMNLNQFIYAFAMGAIFAVVIEATGSILTSMIIHFVINGTSVFLIYAMPWIKAYAELVYGKDKASEMFANSVKYSAETLIPIIMSYAVIAVFTTILAILLLILMSKVEGRWEYFKGIFKKRESLSEDAIEAHSYEKNKGKLGSFTLYVGIIICIILMILVEISK